MTLLDETAKTATENSGQGQAAPPAQEQKRADLTVAQQQAALQKPGTELQGQRMRGDLVVGNRGLNLSTLSELWRFSECVVQSAMFPQVRTPQQAMVAIEMGLELGVPPLQALQNIAVINGRACVWGDTMLALVYASSLLTAIEEKIEGDGDRMIAHCTVKRRGFESATTRSYSVQDAVTAGLWAKKDNWKNYPKRMLQMRARGFALRDVFPDVLKGMITREEADDMVVEAKTVSSLPASGGRAPWGFQQSLPPGGGEELPPDPQ